MTTSGAKATAAQIDASIEIEREAGRLRDTALRADLKFLAYLIDMAKEEAASIAHRKRVASEGSTTSSA